MHSDYNPALGLYISVDPGYTNPFACLWIMSVEKGERVVVLDEYYQRFMTTPENARAIAKQHREMGHPPLKMGYGDPANPERLVLLGEVLGIEVKGPRLPVEVGQELVKQWLERRYDGRPCLVIHHRCKNLIREIRAYLEHHPGSGQHHALDALRYFFCGWKGK
jgi:hypothetical protein